MKKHLIILVALFSLASCKSKQNADLAETLPKDVALKPERSSSQTADVKKLQVQKSQIDSLIATVPCKNEENWRISPLGSKACGGPAGYIAYPVEMENEVLPLIKNYTQQSDAFNKKFGIISDCAMVPPPSGIRCQNGKPVLLRSIVGERNPQ